MCSGGGGGGGVEGGSRGVEGGGGREGVKHVMLILTQQKINLDCLFLRLALLPGGW